MNLSSLIAAFALLASIEIAASAEVKTIERAFRGPPGEEIRIGVFVNIRPDCSAGPLPTIRLAIPPKNGKVTIRQAQVNILNVNQCLAVQTQGLVAYYRSEPKFIGSDQLFLEVRSSEGSIEAQKISVTVAPGLKSEKI